MSEPTEIEDAETKLREARRRFEAILMQIKAEAAFLRWLGTKRQAAEKLAGVPGSTPAELEN
jgi:hypothetical protein